MTDEAIAAAAVRLRTVSADLKAKATALLLAVDAVSACGVEVRDFDRKHVQVRFIEQMPYVLEKKAEALVPKKVSAK